MMTAVSGSADFGVRGSVGDTIIAYSMLLKVNTDVKRSRLSQFG